MESRALGGRHRRAMVSQGPLTKLQVSRGQRWDGRLEGLANVRGRKKPSVDGVESWR